MSTKTFGFFLVLLNKFSTSFTILDHSQTSSSFDEGRIQYLHLKKSLQVYDFNYNSVLSFLRSLWMNITVYTMIYIHITIYSKSIYILIMN